jgi:hypothetical protein
MPNMKAKIETTTRVVTTKSHELRISNELILALLRNAGARVPSDAEVHFHVPGGGNWSNTSIEVSDEDPVHVTWKDENEYEEDDTLEVLLEKIQKGGE